METASTVSSRSFSSFHQHTTKKKMNNSSSSGGSSSSNDGPISSTVALPEGVSWEQGTIQNMKNIYGFIDRKYSMKPNSEDYTKFPVVHFSYDDIDESMITRTMYDKDIRQLFQSRDPVEYLYIPPLTAAFEIDGIWFDGHPYKPKAVFVKKPITASSSNASGSDPGLMLPLISSVPSTSSTIDHNSKGTLSYFIDDNNNVTEYYYCPPEEHVDYEWRTVNSSTSYSDNDKKKKKKNVKKKITVHNDDPSLTNVVRKTSKPQVTDRVTKPKVPKVIVNPKRSTVLSSSTVSVGNDPDRTNKIPSEYIVTHDASLSNVTSIETYTPSIPDSTMPFDMSSVIADPKPSVITTSNVDTCSSLTNMESLNDKFAPIEGDIINNIVSGTRTPSTSLSLTDIFSINEQLSLLSLGTTATPPLIQSPTSESISQLTGSILDANIASLSSGLWDISGSNLLPTEPSTTNIEINSSSFSSSPFLVPTITTNGSNDSNPSDQNPSIIPYPPLVVPLISTGRSKSPPLLIKSPETGTHKSPAILPTAFPHHPLSISSNPRQILGPGPTSPIIMNIKINDSFHSTGTTTSHSSVHTLSPREQYSFNGLYHNGTLYFPYPTVSVPTGTVTPSMYESVSTGGLPTVAYPWNRSILHPIQANHFPNFGESMDRSHLPTVTKKQGIP